MKDLQPYKNKLMELTYEEKIQMSEWLHTEIDLERGEAVKEKMKVVGKQVDNFLDKATKLTQKAGNSLLDQFRSADSKEPEKKP